MPLFFYCIVDYLPGLVYAFRITTPPNDFSSWLDPVDEESLNRIFRLGYTHSQLPAFR